MLRRFLLAAAAATTLASCAPSPYRWRLEEPEPCPARERIPAGILDVVVDETPQELREGVLGHGPEQRRILADAVTHAVMNSGAFAPDAPAALRLRGCVLLFASARIGIDFPARLAVRWQLEVAKSGRILWETVIDIDSGETAGLVPRNATNRFTENRNAVVRGSVRVLLMRLRSLARRMQTQSITL